MWRYTEEELAAASIADIEEAFWRMVEEGSSGKSVDVHYGGGLYKFNPVNP